MITSWCGNVIRITGYFLGESIGRPGIPEQRVRNKDLFFFLVPGWLNKLLNIQLMRWLFETPLCSCCYSNVYKEAEIDFFSEIIVTRGNLKQTHSISTVPYMYVESIDVVTTLVLIQASVILQWNQYLL